MESLTLTSKLNTVSKYEVTVIHKFYRREIRFNGTFATLFWFHTNFTIATAWTDSTSMLGRTRSHVAFCVWPLWHVRQCRTLNSYRNLRANRPADVQRTLRHPSLSLLSEPLCGGATANSNLFIIIYFYLFMNWQLSKQLEDMGRIIQIIVDMK